MAATSSSLLGLGTSVVSLVVAEAELETADDFAAVWAASKSLAVVKGVAMVEQSSLFVFVGHCPLFVELSSLFHSYFLSQAQDPF